MWERSKFVKIERNQGKYGACCTRLSTSLQFYNLKKMFLLEREKEEKQPEISVDWIKGIAFQYAKHLGNWIFHILASCTGDLIVSLS